MVLDLDGKVRPVTELAQTAEVTVGADGFTAPPSELAAILAIAVADRRQTVRRLCGVAVRQLSGVSPSENGAPYTSNQLNWRFSKMTRRAGIGRWHAHEGRQQRRANPGHQRHRGH